MDNTEVLTGIGKNDVEIVEHKKYVGPKKRQRPSLVSPLKPGLSIPIPERKPSFGFTHTSRSTPIQSPYQRSPSVRRQSLHMRGKRRRKSIRDNMNIRN